MSEPSLLRLTKDNRGQVTFDGFPCLLLSEEDVETILKVRDDLAEFEPQGRLSSLRELTSVRLSGGVVAHERPYNAEFLGARGYDNVGYLSGWMNRRCDVKHRDSPVRVVEYGCAHFGGSPHLSIEYVTFTSDPLIIHFAFNGKPKAEIRLERPFAFKASQRREIRMAGASLGIIDEPIRWKERLMTLVTPDGDRITIAPEFGTLGSKVLGWILSLGFLRGKPFPQNQSLILDVRNIDVLDDLELMIYFAVWMYIHCSVYRHSD